MADRRFDQNSGSVHGPLQPSTDRSEQNESQSTHALQRDPIDQVACRAGDRSCATAHASTLNRATASHPARAERSLLQLQRQYGNRYVQRVLDLAMIHRDGDDTQHQDPFVGQNRLVDPQDKMCTITFTTDGPKWLTPSGVSCDPPVGQGDPLKYPADQPEAPSGFKQGIDRPSDCPPERWVPPSPQNLYSGHCQPPGTTPQVSTDGGTTLPPAPVPQPIVTWGTPEMYPPDQQPVDTSTQPGDYNIPSPDEDKQSA